MGKKKKAIALYSGGLDSILAIKLIQEQHVEVIGLSFISPFIENRNHFFGEKILDIPIIRKDISNDFLKILNSPKHGYGKLKNPCIDCRILMFRKAGEVMKQENAFFMISGEVLGQRPMTQNKRSLLMIDHESGYNHWIIRPLSALLLPETEPEKMNIVDRSKLLDIQGRSRKKQMALAESWGIKKYPAPAGGCRLTEPGFAKRMGDLLIKKRFSLNDIDLLKVGRHFVLHQYVKLVVGRNEKENKKIFSLALPRDYLLSSQNYKGPISLLRLYGHSDDKLIEIDAILDLASRITARYCDKNDFTELVDINICKSGQESNHIRYVRALSDQMIESYRI